MENQLGIYKLDNRLVRLAIIADFGETFVYETQDGRWFTSPDVFFKSFKKVSDALTWEEFNNQITQGHKQHKEKS